MPPFSSGFSVVLRVSLGAGRPQGKVSVHGMVYLWGPDSVPRIPPDAPVGRGLPLWYLVRKDRLLRDLRRPGERVPRDRRSLPRWARGVVFREVNVEVSDLGTFLVGRAAFPPGLWIHYLFRSTGEDGPDRRLEGLFPAAPGSVPTKEMLAGSIRLGISPPEEEGNPPSPLPGRSRGASDPPESVP